MTTRGGLLLLGIMILVGVGYFGLRQLGLVRGAGSGTANVELVLEAAAGDLGRGRAEADKALDDAREIIARRVEALGPREASVSRQGANRILVRVDGIKDAATARALILAPGRVELRLVDLMADPDQIELGRAPVGSEILRYSGEGGRGPARIAVQRRSFVTSGMIKDAQQRFDATGEPVVAITLTNEGARRLARTTGENVGKPLAIVIDDVVLSAPMINEPITGGMAQIGGSFTVESANDLAILIDSGALPIQLVVVEDKTPAHAQRD